MYVILYISLNDFYAYWSSGRQAYALLEITANLSTNYICLYITAEPSY